MSLSGSMHVIGNTIMGDTCVHGSRGGGVGPFPPSLWKAHSYRFLSNTGPDPLKIHKFTKPAFNVGPSSALLLHTLCRNVLIYRGFL